MQVGEFVWLDWANVPGPFDYLGLALGALGLWIALRQLAKSQGSLQAAEDALNDTRRSLMTNQLQVVLPKLLTVSEQIDTALIEDDRTGARKRLTDFRIFAAEAVQLIESTQVYQAGKGRWYAPWKVAEPVHIGIAKEDADLISSLKGASQSAETANSGFYEGDRTAEQVAGSAAAEISRVVSATQKAITRKMNNVTEKAK